MKSGHSLAADQTDVAAFGDLLALLGLSVVGGLAIGVLDPAWPIRLVIALPLLLFAPGYVTTSALFPTRSLAAIIRDGRNVRDATPMGVAVTRDGPQSNGTTRAVVERIVYSIGLSLGIVPILGRVLVATSGGFSGPRLLGSVCVFVAVVSGVAIMRRYRTPSMDRFSAADVLPARNDLLAPLGTGPARVTIAVVVIGALFAAGSVSFAVAGSVDGESHSELYLLAQNDSGELQATDYPQQYVAGQSTPLVVVVENHEGSAGNYTVVSELHRVDEDTGAVVVRERLGRFSDRIPANDTFRRTHDVRPTLLGERLRLTYLLYRGPTPAEPTVENADQTVHLWVTVTESADGNRSMDARLLSN